MGWRRDENRSVFNNERSNVRGRTYRRPAHTGCDSTKRLQLRECKTHSWRELWFTSKLKN